MEFLQRAQSRKEELQSQDLEKAFENWCETHFAGEYTWENFATDFVSPYESEPYRHICINALDQIVSGKISFKTFFHYPKLAKVLINGSESFFGFNEISAGFRDDVVKLYRNARKQTLNDTLVLSQKEGHYSADDIISRFNFTDTLVAVVGSPKDVQVEIAKRIRALLI